MNTDIAAFGLRVRFVAVGLFHNTICWGCGGLCCLKFLVGVVDEIFFGRHVDDSLLWLEIVEMVLDGANRLIESLRFLEKRLRQRGRKVKRCFGMDVESEGSLVVLPEMLRNAGARATKLI